MGFYALLSCCLPITVINSLEGCRQCILSKHLASEYPPIKRKRKDEEIRTLKVKKLSELLKLKMGVYPKSTLSRETALWPSIGEFCMMLCGSPTQGVFGILPAKTCLIIALYCLFSRHLISEYPPLRRLFGLCRRKVHILQIGVASE